MDQQKEERLPLLSHRYIPHPPLGQKPTEDRPAIQGTGRPHLPALKKTKVVLHPSVKGLSDEQKKRESIIRKLYKILKEKEEDNCDLACATINFQGEKKRLEGEIKFLRAFLADTQRQNKALRNLRGKAK